MEGKKLFLLDAYALIFRAYHAMKYSPRFTSDGMNTSAIFGFVNTLEEVLRKENPSHIAVCFDPAGKTFRHEMFPDYKAGREATPEDIKIAVPFIKDIIRAYGIPVVEKDGYEADDVIGTLAVKSRDRGFDTFIMSPDKDLSQLVDATIKVFRPGYKGAPAEVRGEKEVCEIFGINRPSQVIDILALMGDKVDNIIGCPGVGEKTASKLILEFDSVENLIANTAKLKGAVKTKVESNVDNILFSKKLATICTEAPIAFDEEAYKRHDIDADAIRDIFGRLEFRSLLSRVLGDKATATPAAKPAPAKAQTSMELSLFDDNSLFAGTEADSQPAEQTPPCNITIATEADIVDLVDKALAQQSVGIYIASTNGSAMDAVPMGIAVALSPTEAFYIEIADESAADINRLLTAAVEKVGINLKFDMVAAPKLGIDISEPYYDVAVAHYLLQPEMSHTLDRLAEIYLKKLLPSYPVPQTAKPGKFDPAKTLDAEEIAPVACARAAACLELKPVLDRLLDDEGMKHLLTDIELPLIKVLADMERTGVRIDTEALAAYSESLTQRLADIEAQCIGLAEVQFNVGSPAQVGEVLFDRLKIDEKAKKTKSGQYSTTEEVLEKLAHKHPIVEKILEFRKIKKLLSTYVNALPELINPNTGRIHTTYNQTVTATGRLSSTNPNLQNIPIRNDDGREIRKAFIPAEGNSFFSADYSQIELRIVANISHDEALVEAFLAGEDIHRATAAKIFHEDIAAVTDDQRRKAKTANFGMIYGISAFGLSERLQIARGEAKQLIEDYFATFPGVRKFMDESVEQAKAKGYVVTLFGRRRMLPDIASRNAVVRGYAERNAINAPIQGTAADIIKIAMNRIFRRFGAEGVKSKMILQVHDELNFDVVPGEEQTVARIVKEEMEAAYCGTVPLIADCGTGTNWLEAH